MTAHWRKVGELDFPPEWLDGRRWIEGPEIVLGGTVSDTRTDVVLAGGVLDDGTNLIGLAYRGGQRLARMSPTTDWALEERFNGRPLKRTDHAAKRLWKHTVQSMIAAANDVRRELGIER